MILAILLFFKLALSDENATNIKEETLYESQMTQTKQIPSESATNLIPSEITNQSLTEQFNSVHETVEPPHSPFSQTETSEEGNFSTSNVISTETSYPSQTVLPTSNTPVITETPHPENEYEKFYVCEGEACDKCKDDDDDHDDDEIQVDFEGLNDLLANNINSEIEIIVCGSSREKHPSIHLQYIQEKELEFTGKNTEQYIEFIHLDDDAIIYELKAKNICIICNESLHIYNAKLKQSPIESPELTFSNLDSDLVSLAYTGNFSPYNGKVEDDSISKIIFENEAIILKSDQYNATLLLIDEDSDFLVSVQRESINFTLVGDLAKSAIDFKIELTDKSNEVFANFDSSWENSNPPLLQINHENCHLYIQAPSDNFANSIAVDGSGKVTRNGKDDPYTETPSTITSDGNHDDNDDDSSNSQAITVGMVIVAVIIVVILLVIIYVVIKKWRARKNHKYITYLNNSRDLELIDPI